MAALPLFKLGVLLVKQLTKPVAKWIKSEATEHPILRRVCIYMGQLSHRVQTQVDVRMLGAEITQVKPLGEKIAESRGAEFLSESFIFSVGAGLLILEYSRSAREKAESNSKAQMRSELKQQLIKARFLALESEAAALRAHLSVLESSLNMSADQQQQVAAAEHAVKAAKQRTEGIRQAAKEVAPVLAGEEADAVQGKEPVKHLYEQLAEGSSASAAPASPTAQLDAQAAQAAAHVDDLKERYEEMKRLAAEGEPVPRGWWNLFGLGIDLTALSSVFFGDAGDAMQDAVHDALHEHAGGVMVDVVNTTLNAR